MNLTRNYGAGAARVTGVRALAGGLLVPRRRRYRFARNGIVVAA